jgi:ferredoxin-type protein NapH
MSAWRAGDYGLPDTIRTRLPAGNRARRAYDNLYLAGGGVAVSYLSIPAVDPVAGAVAAVGGGLSSRFAIGLAIPIVLGLLLGRIFCGWLCPFGTLSRAIAYLLEHVPWRVPFRVPRRRPVRWAVLAVAVAASAMGTQVLLFLLLPHLLVQQTVYSMWLLGGGGALLGALIGLVVAGLFFGPTLYCATVCPTGAVLGALGRARRVHLTLAEPSSCGSHCTLCAQACWIQLDPASGDPGPDCDLCARCVEACPQINLTVTTSRPRRKHLPVVTATLLGLSLLGNGGIAHAELEPELVLNAEVRRGDVVIAVSLVDIEGTRLDPDDPNVRRGVELSVFIGRGDPGAPDELGFIEGRSFYRGPLVLEIHNRGTSTVVEWRAPNSPRSTVNRAIYRRALPALRPAPGDRVVIRAIPEWLPEPVRITIPRRSPGSDRAHTVVVAFGAALLFAGLLSLALAVPDRAAKT